MCPDLVTAAQRIASLNPLVTAEVYDIAHFPDLKEKYHVMSVPCLIINQDKTIIWQKEHPTDIGINLTGLHLLTFHECLTLQSFQRLSLRRTGFQRC